MQSSLLYSSPARFIALRLVPQEDLLARLCHLMKEHTIRAGFIAGCVGSLSQFGLRFAGQDRTTIETGCFEVVSLMGTLDLQSAHLHLAVSDQHGRLQGGHVMDGCIVRTTMELIIGILTEVQFSRQHCEISGYEELIVSQLTMKKE